MVWLQPSVVESTATAMSPNTHIIPPGSGNITQLTLGCLEALGSQGRLLRTALGHTGVGAGLRVHDDHDWGGGCGGGTRSLLSEARTVGPEWSLSATPPDRMCLCLYVNICEEFCTVPSNNVRESNLINLHFDICLRNTPGGMSGLSNRFL